METYISRVSNKNSTRFTGRVVGLSGTKLTIRVDRECVSNMSAIHSHFSETDQLGDFITLNTVGCSFNIKNYEWKELEDLVGLHVNINYSARTFRPRTYAARTQTRAVFNARIISNIV